MSLRSTIGLGGSSRYNDGLFALTILFTLALGVLGILYPEAFAGTMDDLFGSVLHYFGWWYMLLGLVLTIAVLAFAVSRYGNLRIGGQDAEKEFGLFSWFSMVFTVGFAASVIFSGVSQPVATTINPPDPLPIDVGSPEVLSLAFMYTHDVLPGLLAWFLPFAIAMGIISLGQANDFRVSTILSPILDRETYGVVYWVTDLAAMVAILGGLATSLGLIGVQIQVIVQESLGISQGWLIYVLFVLVGLIFMGDVYLGLRKGIRNAARITTVLIVILMSILWIVGPTLFTSNMLIDSVGVWLNHMPRLMTYADPVGGSDWGQGYTSFWWAWFAAWGIFVGTFVARVSRGRTIREMILGAGFGPAIFLVFQHAILGSWALHPDNFGPISSALESGSAYGLAEAINITPLSSLIALLFVAVLIGYLITSLDSAVYMLASINTGNEEPNARIRAVWGVMLAFLGIMTLELPGSDVMETFAAVFSLPFTIFFLVLMYCAYVTAKDRYNRLSNEYGHIPSRTTGPDPGITTNETSDADAPAASTETDD